MEEKMKNERSKGKQKIPEKSENDDLNGNTLEDDEDYRSNQNQPYPIEYLTTEAAVTQVTTTPLPPIISPEIENDSVSSIEIKSDGTSGHLQPEYDYES